MANHPSALKRHRQSLKRRARNRAGRSRLRSERKTLLEAIAAAEKGPAAQQLKSLQVLLDRAADRGLIHKNTAARIKSRSQLKLNALP